MPYNSISDLPDQVKDNLPKDEWAQWMQVFNSVYAAAVEKHEKDPDIHAFKAAWSVVKKQEGLSEGEDENWITIDGTHVLVKSGETPEQAFKRTTGKELTPSTKGQKGFSVLRDGKKVDATIERSELRPDVIHEKLKTTDGSVVGTLRTTIEEDGIHIDYVAGAREYGTNYEGAGTILTAHTVQESFDKGLNGRVTLTSYPEAEGFYEKLGFKQSGVGYKGYKQYVIEGDSAKKLLKLVGKKYGS